MKDFSVDFTSTILLKLFITSHSQAHFSTLSQPFISISFSQDLYLLDYLFMSLSLYPWLPQLPFFTKLPFFSLTHTHTQLLIIYQQSINIFPEQTNRHFCIVRDEHQITADRIFTTEKQVGRHFGFRSFSGIDHHYFKISERFSASRHRTRATQNDANKRFKTHLDANFSSPCWRLDGLVGISVCRIPVDAFLRHVLRGHDDIASIKRWKTLGGGIVQRLLRLINRRHFFECGKAWIHWSNHLVLVGGKLVLQKDGRLLQEWLDSNQGPIDVVSHCSVWNWWKLNLFASHE